MTDEPNLSTEETTGPDPDPASPDKPDEVLPELPTQDYTFEITLLGFGAVVIGMVIVLVVGRGQIPFLTAQPQPTPILTPAPTPVPPTPAPTPPPDPVVEEYNRLGTADTPEEIETDLEATDLGLLDQTISDLEDELDRLEEL